MYDNDYTYDNSSLFNAPEPATSVLNTGIFLFGGLFLLALMILSLVVMWRVFVKAGKPGWGSLVPIYNTYLLLKIAGRPGWWLLLLFIPIVNMVVLLLMSLDIAKAFGKSPTFGVLGLWLFTMIGFTMLAFDSSKYTPPVPDKPVTA